jgi:hypothetical protein
MAIDGCRVSTTDFVGGGGGVYVTTRASDVIVVEHRRLVTYKLNKINLGALVSFSPAQIF